MGKIDERIERILLYVTTPHPMLHPCEWIKCFKRWLKKLIEKRDSIEAQFVDLENAIGALTGQSILDEYWSYAVKVDAKTRSISILTNDSVEALEDNLAYWAKWQIDNL